MSDLEHDDPLDALLAEEEDSESFSPVPHLVGAPGVGSETPIPPATEDNLICLRGPCKHYFELVKRFEAGNRGSDDLFKQKLRYCTAILGDSTELTDQAVFECSHWEPIPITTLTRRQHARKNWEERKKNENA